MAPPLAIDADGLSKRYGETVAVDSLDPAVEPGIRISRTEGAGKTTTMRTLTTLTTPTEGSARVAGAPASDTAGGRRRHRPPPRRAAAVRRTRRPEQSEYVAALRDLPEGRTVDTPRPVRGVVTARAPARSPFARPRATRSIPAA